MFELAGEPAGGVGVPATLLVEALADAGEALVDAIDAAHARVSVAQRDLLALVARVDRAQAWRDSGARDLAHWLAMRFGISQWKARRWIVAGHALESLLRLAAALSTGALSLDKVVELARFATPADEADLIAWARRVSCAAVRRRGDAAVRSTHDALVEIERSRFLSWWYFDDGRRFGLEAELPAAQGAIVARSIERLARRIPAMPDEEDASDADARRADALVALCSSRIARDTDPDRATLIVHAQGDGAAAAEPARSGGEIEGGPAIPAEAVERLRCNARTQTVVEDRLGNVVALGRTSREPSAWMLRQVRYRDRECRFPGCGSRRFTEAHHVVWWRHGGRTDLDNLALICTFHHRLVHEHGWTLTRDRDGELRWFRPGGVRYRAGPGPAT
jgi:hypothetical protein